MQPLHSEATVALARHRILLVLQLLMPAAVVAADRMGLHLLVLVVQVVVAADQFLEMETQERIILVAVVVVAVTLVQTPAVQAAPVSSS